MSTLTAQQKELLNAAKAVCRFWQATCDAHPDRKGWEDHMAFYRLSEAVDGVENA